MDFSWQPEQRELYDRMVEFAQTSLNADVAEHDRDNVFPLDKWQRCADEGIHGLALPKAFGGADRDILTVTLAMEGLGYGCRDNGLLLALNAQMWTLQMAILHAGTEEQKHRYLPELAAGRMIGAYAITEPEAGSDAYSLKARADRCDDGYRLNGHKTLISLAAVADVALVFASTAPEAGAWGVSAFLVERDTPGFETGPAVDKMGLRTIPMAEIRLTDCVVPTSARLGAEGGGMALSNSSLEWERSCMLATCIGVMQRAPGPPRRPGVDEADTPLEPQQTSDHVALDV